MSGLRVTVVGAGIVGLATAYHLVKAGAHVTVLDDSPGGDKTSYGNAGAIASSEVVPAGTPGVWWRSLGWMLDPLGPLAVRPAHAPKLIPWLLKFARSSTPPEVARISSALAALNDRIYGDLLPMLEDTGQSAHLHRNGALTIYESDEEYDRDAPEWAYKKAHGVELEELTAAEARTLEPALGSRVQRAVFMPGWSHVSDPRQTVTHIREWLLGHHVAIQEVKVESVRPGERDGLTIVSCGGQRIPTDRTVIAAGAWSGILARRLGDRVLLESERGYNTTVVKPGITIERVLVFAAQKFVVSPLSCGLRIGGAAEFGGLRAPANFERSRRLAELATRYLPQLRAASGTYWAGHRPATPDSLPVIGPSARVPHVFYAFGHGHLGLTQAATTGRLVTEGLLGKPVSIDMSPYSIGRFR